MKKVVTIVSGVALGATVGAIAAVLTTPKSGQETRDALKERSQKLATCLRRQARKLEKAH